jgi:hypothetical protein
VKRVRGNASIRRRIAERHRVEATDVRVQHDTRDASHRNCRQAFATV